MSESDINKLLTDISNLREQLKEKENNLVKLMSNGCENGSNKYCANLNPEDITRYSRQMLVPEVGIDGQEAINNAKVLVVGAGGLGCPASVYLASAGIGELAIIDYDEVELSNLHRQILHNENDVNKAKVDSAFEKLQSINRRIKIVPLKLHADSTTIKELFKNNTYDVVIDGSDNVATRYLLNDVCVFNKVPLVSGSALQLEGQLTVYNYQGGPCYRCLFPVPPPPETVTSCGDGGVVGPVPGVIGVLEALEAIKIIIKSPGVLSGRLLLFDGSITKFRDVKLRTRNSKCAVCGEEPTITDLIDYEQFCGAAAHDKVINIDILDSTDHINVKELSTKIGKNNCLVIDVRPSLQFQMCRLPNTHNIPLTDLKKPESLDKIRNLINEHNLGENGEVYLLCRRGNDSQRAVTEIKRNMPDVTVKFLNVKDGLHGYAMEIDKSFPVF
ncbi:hypothetical protein GWI33_018618 [Rhynchophorus ferrugineus]|uniref:Adenylyltransferase and sulfurtransferase MOCS3 homolog n=1 Tax=Rhynchophorus ferrugineus TaxID=354439 RepID=A0A834M293_RHYFE|nr:hypothetical protein GWI33_018618 [Rhynchophorus ferrugineus]